jgi:hypothetical protein
VHYSQSLEHRQNKGVYDKQSLNYTADDYPINKRVHIDKWFFLAEILLSWLKD